MKSRKKYLDMDFVKNNFIFEYESTTFLQFSTNCRHGTYVKPYTWTYTNKFLFDNPNQTQTPTSHWIKKRKRIMKIDIRPIKRGGKGPMTDLPTAAEAARNYQESPASVLSSHETARSSVLGGGNPISSSSAAVATIHRRLPAKAIALGDQSGTDRFCDLGSGEGTKRNSAFAAGSRIVRRERCVVGEEIIYKLLQLE